MTMIMILMMIMIIRMIAILLLVLLLVLAFLVPCSGCFGPGPLVLVDYGSGIRPPPGTPPVRPPPPRPSPWDTPWDGQGRGGGRSSTSLSTCDEIRNRKGSERFLSHADGSADDGKRLVRGPFGIRSD